MNNLEYKITINSTQNTNNQPIINTTDGISSYNEYILNSLNSYFGSINSIKSTNEIDRILPILSGQSKLSIRVIDWFVTNYSKKNNIVYPLNEKNNKVTNWFNVYLDYKSQLKGYKKKLFDPFCRKRRIPFYYTNEKCLITTPGQLNFFKWALSNKVLDYVEEHFDEINKDMNRTIKAKSTTNSNNIENHDLSDAVSSSSSDKKKYFLSENLSSDKKRSELSDNASSDKKRHELSENALKTINCYKMKIILDMN